MKIKIRRIILILILIIIAIWIKRFTIDNNVETVIGKLDREVSRYREKDANILLENKQYKKATKVLMNKAIKDGFLIISNEDLKGNSPMMQYYLNLGNWGKTTKLLAKIEDVLIKYYPDEKFVITKYTDNLSTLKDEDIIRNLKALEDIYNIATKKEQEYMRKYFLRYSSSIEYDFKYLQY